MSSLRILTLLLDIGWVVGLVAASQFWWRARRVALPPAMSGGDGATVRSVQAFADRVERAGMLNAKAGVCLVAAAACQAGSMSAFLAIRAQL